LKLGINTGIVGGGCPPHEKANMVDKKKRHGPGMGKAQREGSDQKTRDQAERPKEEGNHKNEVNH